MIIILFIILMIYLFLKNVDSILEAILLGIVGFLAGGLLGLIIWSGLSLIPARYTDYTETKVYQIQDYVISNGEIHLINSETNEVKSIDLDDNVFIHFNADTCRVESSPVKAKNIIWKILLTDLDEEYNIYLREGEL